MYENQRFDFDVWGRVYRKESYDGAPRLQPNPLAEMMRLWAKRNSEPVKYETHRDPEELTRDEIEAAYQAVGWIMEQIKETDREAHDCLMARHVRTFEDARGVSWARAQLPERMMAKAMFGGNPQSAQSRFRRACERGYAAYQRLAA